MPRAEMPLKSKKSTPIILLTPKAFNRWSRGQSSRISTWLKAQEFKAEVGNYCLIPDLTGRILHILAVISDPPSLWDLSALPSKLPKGRYYIEWDGPHPFLEWLVLGWNLGCYEFTRYKKSKKNLSQLSLPKEVDAAKIRRYADAIKLARDLINTTAEDMGPEELAGAIKDIGNKYGAKITQTIGPELLKKNFPAIHTVGRASARPPRLVDLTWGDPRDPKITLVGKGVCFDTGGLDLKGSSNMYLMKKDMGGAACSLAIAMMIMDAKLPVRLRLLVPAVENSISGNAYRPSDVIKMRSGLTVEVGNTDAEGRLILADALTEAVSEKPKLLIDFSTLTGAARTAVGNEISALFSNNDKLADELITCGKDMEDLVWRLPLHIGYNKMLESSIADLNSAPNSPYAGAITAALFLQKFVTQDIDWAHFDFMAWNTSTRAGRPEGGEAMAVRAVYRMIENRILKA